MLFTPTLDGNAVFGLAVRIQMVPNPTAQQLVKFFGVDGQFAMYGGSCGRVFMIEGVLYDMTIAALNADETNLLSFADGVGHQLSDTRGRVWDYVVSRNEYHPSPHGPKPATWSDGSNNYSGYALPYKLILRGLL